MRSSTFLKFSGALFIVALLALGTFQGTTLAGPLVQAATAATAAVSFPPCPPPAGAATSAANGATSGAAASTAAMTVEATGAAGAAGASTATPPGYIGIRVFTVDSCGVRILEVLPSTPAATAGLKAEDVIVAVNGTAFHNSGELRVIMNNYHAGDTLQLTVQRAGADSVVSVTLAVPPANFPPTTAAQPPAGGAATVPATVPAAVPGVGTAPATPAATAQ